ARPPGAVALLLLVDAHAISAGDVAARDDNRQVVIPVVMEELRLSVPRLGIPSPPVVDRQLRIPLRDHLKGVEESGACEDLGKLRGPRDVELQGLART